MTWVAVQQRAWYQDKRLWIAVGVAACLAILALPHLQRYYRRWSGQRHVRRAAEASARGDLKAAILDGRAALTIDSGNVEALRVIAKALETRGMQSAVQYRRQLDAIKPGDAENLLAIADDCLKAGDINAAEETLKSIKPADRESARYHGLAAAVASSHGDSSAAEAHLSRAVEIEPKDDDFRLKLNHLRLESRGDGVREQALVELRALAEKPASRLGALRILLGDAAAHGDARQADHFAEILAADPQSTFGDKLHRLSSLRSPKDSQFSFSNLQEKKEFYTLLERMQEGSAANPVEAFQLLTWMNEHDLALAGIEWGEKLPQQMRDRPPVCLALAESYARCSAWEKLQQKLEKIKWEQGDFLRVAYIARSRERLHDDGGARTAWNRAVSDAEGNPAWLESLAKTALQWDWAQKAEDVLWKLTALNDPPRWAVDHLWAASLKRHDTPQLYKASKLILKAEPKSVTARDNYVSLSLLTGQDANTSRGLASDLFKENPANALVATTYGLSLYQQGKAGEAATVMSAFSSDELHNPLVALYYGVFLASSGKSEEALPYLEIGGKAPQLPEEKLLGDFFRSACFARKLDTQGDAGGSDAAWSDAVATARSHADLMDWLGKKAGEWGWKERAESEVMKIAAEGRCPVWATDVLWSASLKTGDSSILYKSSKLIAETDPKNSAARNRYVLVSLLTRHEAESSQRSAADLHRENPSDSDITVTFGLSLLQQGKAQEAVGLLKTLPPERLHQPRISLYLGFFTAAGGDASGGQKYLLEGMEAARLPEEKALAGMFLDACRAGALFQSGSLKDASEKWDAAVAQAVSRPDWMELLGKIAVGWNWQEEAQKTLWKLADAGACPAWVADYLWTVAEKAQDSVGLYKASRLVMEANPTNVAARSRFIGLSLLTGHSSDFPERLAGGLHRENPVDADVSVTYALSLYLQGKHTDALTVMQGLKPDQLREPRAALYYGIFLTGAGQQGKAREYLEIGARNQMLREEAELLKKAEAPSAGRY